MMMATRTRTLQLLLWALFFLSMEGAYAQAIYKCGGTIQDRPCEGEVQMRYSSKSGTFSGALLNPKGDLRCLEAAQLGERVAQARREGKSREQLLAVVESPDRRTRVQFVEHVLGLSGSPRDVRIALESACDFPGSPAPPEKTSVTLQPPQIRMSGGGTMEILDSGLLSKNPKAALAAEAATAAQAAAIAAQAQSSQDLANLRATEAIERASVSGSQPLSTGLPLKDTPNKKKQR